MSRPTSESEYLRYLRNWEQTLSRVSNGFIRLPEGSLDSAIDDALARVGSFAEADRCYVFLYDAGNDEMSNTHEWCGADVEAEIENLQRVPASTWPSWMEKLHAFEIIDVPRVRDLPEAARAEREALTAQGIQSVVVVPIVDRDLLLGFVGFDAVETERAWNSDEVRLLQMSADIVANALVRRRNEAELRAVRNELFQANKMEALGRFVGGTAHDFNNLLTVILGNCELEETTATDELRERFDEIRIAAERGADLTRQLLTFSRKQPAKREPLDVNELVRANVRFVERILGKAIRVRCELDPEAGFIRADANQLQQLLLNLAANSRDALPNGGELHLRTTRSDPGAPGSPVPTTTLEVSDTGCGMDEETLSHAFEPFFTTKEVGAGTGLGLSSVYGIISQNDGSIDIRSDPGRGTDVRMSFPSVAPATSTAASHVERDAGSPGGTIVLLEDDPSVLRLLRSTLESWGFHVLAAGRAEQALSTLEDPTVGVDLVVTDLVMPGLCGVDVIRRVSALRPELPFVVITGYSSDAGLLEIAPSANVQMLPKPFRPAELHATIRELLR